MLLAYDGINRACHDSFQEIDEAIAQARTRGYSTLMTLGHKGLTYATNVVVKTAIKVGFHFYM